MKLGRTGLARAWPVLVAGATLSLVQPAPARAQQAVASGGATIVQPVGAGVTYDVATKVLTAIFLSGQTGEQLSFLLPGKRLRQRSQPAGMQSFTARGNIVVLSTETVSINIGTVDPSPGPTGPNGGTDTMLVLAQFN